MSGPKRPDDLNNIEAPNEAFELRRATHVFFLILVAGCLAFVIWALVFTINIASMAEGEVMPSTQIKSVQHLEGGIVEKILVKEGEKVKKGQSLVILETTAAGSDVGQLASKIASFKIDIARLEAELDNYRKIRVPADVMEKHPDIVQEAIKYFQARHKRYLNDYEAQREKVKQEETQVDEISARLKHLKSQLKLIKEQVQISEDLLKEDITNRYSHITLLREADALESRVAEDTAELSQVQSVLKESTNNFEGFESAHREELTKDLEETKRELDQYSQQMEKFADTFQRAVLKSPVDGVVRQMYVFTKGAVVKPGETVLDILPSDDFLVIDAKLPLQDIGYIRVGQDTMIRLASGDAMRFDAIHGKVTVISPDAIKDEEGNAFYKVRIETKTPYFQRGNVRYQLYPGMKVSVGIITGHRSVMGYILSPIFGSAGQALQER